MKHKLVITSLAVLIALFLGLGLAAAQEAGPGGDGGAQAQVGMAFTYQGRLTDGSSPANGEYDFRFRLYDAGSDGSQVGSAVTQDNVTVTDGLFMVQLDFGDPILDGTFTGDARWLEIAVRPGASTGAYTTLTPRQRLTPAPYALALPGLWTEQNDTSPNLIGGYSGNSVAEGVVGATIGGGGRPSHPNQISADYATIGGGWNNQAAGAIATVGGGGSNEATGYSATVGGGYYNDASGSQATVGGGWNNDATGAYATVGGGYGNDATGDSVTVGGGYGNEATSNRATVGGGYSNEATGSNATVGGGYSNEATSDYATVGGGSYNDATGAYATVPGGRDNVAQGSYSLAAGRRAKALHYGSIILADGNDFSFSSIVPNTFRVRATGGIRFVLGIDGSGNPTWSCLVQDGSSWSCSSDRNLKENLVLADGSDVLERLSQMPVYYWNAKGQATPHIGPMAQDFYAAYGVGDSDTHISTIDLDGVALAAIQGLYAQNKELEKQNTDLEARVAALEATLDNGSEPTRVSQSNLLLWVGIISPWAGILLLWAFRRRDMPRSFNGDRR